MMKGKPAEKVILSNINVNSNKKKNLSTSSHEVELLKLNAFNLSAHRFFIDKLSGKRKSKVPKNILILLIALLAVK